MDRKFGVEIEATGIEARRVADLLQQNGIPCSAMSYTHQVMQSWKVVSDGSVTGRFPFELVSPPLQGAAGIETLRRVMQILRENGATVNTSCGFHVHVDASDLSAEQIKRLVSIAVRFERAIDSLVPASRRGNGFCKSNARTIGRKLDDRLRRIEACATLSELRSLMNMDRYHKLNLEAYARYRTVEFRQHSGTLNGQKAECWIALCLALVASAKRGRSIGITPSNIPSRTNSFFHLMLRVPAQYRQPLTDRRAELAAVNGQEV